METIKNKMKYNVAVKAMNFMDDLHDAVIDIVCMVIKAILVVTILGWYVYTII